MPAGKSRQVYINLAVKDLERSKAFFTKLGFAFNPQFSDGNAACMILSEQGYVMLLTEPFFQTFTHRQPNDTSTTTEVMLALSCESREEVDELAKIAIDNGGKVVMEPKQYDFMYYRTFYDLDGHHWELTWMDPATIEHQAQPQA